MSVDDRMRILLIGPSPPKLAGAAVGGTTIPFKALAAALQERDDVVATVVDTHGVRGGGVRAPFRFLRILLGVTRAVPRSDVVSLHAVRGGLWFLGPVVALLSMIYRKPYIVRKFGGCSHLEYDPVRRAVIDWVVRRAAAYLVETKALVRDAKLSGIEHVRWYSNSRPMPPLPSDSGAERRCRRFVHLGQLRRGKGIYEIIEAGERFGDDVTVDVYGTAGYDVPISVFDGLSRVRYRGPVDPPRVAEVLSRYDVFLLPTFLPTEGYPGVVLEAYCAGIPIIATRWRQLPEMIDGGTGVLIEPRSAEALYRAMRLLYEDAALFARLREGVRMRRSEFSSARWADLFVEYAREVARRGRALPAAEDRSSVI